LRNINPVEDSEFSIERFEQHYNADLANGLGNLVARVSNLLEKNNIEISLKISSDATLKSVFDQKMQEYKFNEALEILWNKLRECDEIITKKQPWKLDDKQEIKNILMPIAQNILNVAELLFPFMPDTAEKVIKQFSEKNIKKVEILFPRI